MTKPEPSDLSALGTQHLAVDSGRITASLYNGRICANGRTFAQRISRKLGFLWGKSREQNLEFSKRATVGLNTENTEDTEKANRVWGVGSGG